MLLSTFVSGVPCITAVVPIVNNLTTTLNVSPAPLCFNLLSNTALNNGYAPVNTSTGVINVKVLEGTNCRIGGGSFFEVNVPFALTTVMPTCVCV